MMSITEFAELCSVSRAAIYKAGRDGHLRIHGGKIDPNTPDARAYRTHVTRQRRQVQEDKQIGRGIYSPDGSGKSHRHVRAYRARQERTGNLGQQLTEAWTSRTMPRGWAVLALADTPDPKNPELVAPLFFYAPGGGEENPVFETELAKHYTVNMEDPEGSSATDEEGKKHPLTIRTFGRVPWLDRAEASMKLKSDHGGEGRASKGRSA